MPLRYELWWGYGIRELGYLELSLLKNVIFLLGLTFMIGLILERDYLEEVLFLNQFAPLAVVQMKIFQIFFLYVLILTWFGRIFSFLSRG
jgi:hypothetical protein